MKKFKLKHFIKKNMPKNFKKDLKKIKIFIFKEYLIIDIKYKNDNNNHRVTYELNKKELDFHYGTYCEINNIIAVGIRKIYLNGYNPLIL